MKLIPFVFVALAMAAVPCACGKSGPCPAEMALVEGAKVCVDRFESSAARDSKGKLGAAISKKGAIPVDSVAWVEADASCRAAGKRLCKSDEWTAACRGKDGKRFPYGKEFEPERCNTYQYGKKTGKTEKRPAGSMPGCDNGSGVMDLSGNVWEWMADADQTGVLRQLWGGGFANDNHEKELTCGFKKPMFQPPNGNFSGIGYRCCKGARL